MDSTDPADYSPLSFGAGLAIGLMLVIGLPRAAPSPTANGADRAGDDATSIAPNRVDNANRFDAASAPRPVTIDAHR